MTGSQRDDKWLSLDLVRTVGPDVSDKDWSVLVKYRFIRVIIKAKEHCLLESPVREQGTSLLGKGNWRLRLGSALSDSMT